VLRVRAIPFFELIGFCGPNVLECQKRWRNRAWKNWVRAGLVSIDYGRWTVFVQSVCVKCWNKQISKGTDGFSCFRLIIGSAASAALYTTKVGWGAKHANTERIADAIVAGWGD